jgi:predicted transcriptional regulator
MLRKEWIQLVDDKTKRMMEILTDNPGIGRYRLVKQANVSHRVAQDFLRKHKESKDQGHVTGRKRVSYDSTPEVVHLQKQVNTLQTALVAEKAAKGELADTLSRILEAVTVCEPEKIVYKKQTGKMQVSNPCCSVLHCSDWHIGKSVRAEQIEEWGEFNYEIAKRRLERLVEYKVNTVELERKSINIQDLVILSTGDMINGALRNSDIATNEFPVCVQPVKAAELFSSVLMAMAPFFRKIYVEWVVPDNHGRVGKKIEFAEPWNSYNYLVAELARAKTAKQKNIVWHIHPGEIGRVEVEGRRYLIRHGHGMKGASYGGISWYKYEQMAGREARKRMRRDRKYQFHRIITGHLHAPVKGRDWWIGGSLSGTDSFDHACGRESEPIQTGWLVHPLHGEINYNEYNLMGVK